MIPTVQQILATTEMKISSGEIVSGKTYLDDAINAFDLMPCDYYSAYKVLLHVANGGKADALVDDIRQFWDFIEKKYS